MAEEADYILLREKTGTTIAQVSDENAGEIFTRMEAAYPTNPAAVFPAAAVEVLESLWARSTEDDVDYSQNEESEDLGDRVKNRKALLDYWQGKLNEATAAVQMNKGRRPAFFGLASAGRRCCP